MLNNLTIQKNCKQSTFYRLKSFNNQITETGNKNCCLKIKSIYNLIQFFILTDWFISILPHSFGLWITEWNKEWMCQQQKCVLEV